MSKYFVNFGNLVEELLPQSLRSQSGFAVKTLVMELLGNLQKLYRQLADKRERQQQLLEYNCQYPLLQKLLNEELDTNGGRRIRVGDTTGDLRTLLVYPNGTAYRQLVVDDPEGNMVVTFPHRLWKYLGFTVWVPADWEDEGDNMKRLKGLVEMYKPLGTKYIIKKTE